MRSFIVALLFATTFAVVFAAPAQSKLKSLQAVFEGDYSQAKLQEVICKFFGPRSGCRDRRFEDVGEFNRDKKAKAQIRGRYILDWLIWRETPHLLISMIVK